MRIDSIRFRCGHTALPGRRIPECLPEENVMHAGRRMPASREQGPAEAETASPEASTGGTEHSLAYTP